MLHSKKFLVVGGKRLLFEEIRSSVYFVVILTYANDKFK